MGRPFNFSICNPLGPGQGNVSALPRRVADEPEDFDVVQVQDITFASTRTADGDDLTMTVGCGRG